MRLRDFEQTLPPEQRWENLTLANDFMFGKIMHDPELCTEMLRRILPDMDIGHIEFTQPQKSAKYSLDTRGVRFDVFAPSDNRKIFDCEVQTSHTRDLAPRSRAYHIIAGLETLEKHTLTTSGTYSNMPETFVIFICTFDTFGLGRHIYTFSNSCHEVDGLKLNDGAVTIFLNARGTADDISKELKAFLDFMLGKSSDDPFVVRLAERMKIAKLNAKWRRVYMRNMLYEREIRAEGFQQGREEGRIEGRTEGLQQGRTEGLQQGRTEGFQQGRNETMNTILELMRIHGFSPEEINAVKAAALKIVTGES